MWQTAATDGTVQKLAALMDAEPMGLLGVSACGEEEDWKYFIAVSSTKPAGEFEEYTVPAATWAVFAEEGTNLSIQDLEQRIVTEWLPTSGYEYGNAPDIEVYLNPDPQNAKFVFCSRISYSFLTLRGHYLPLLNDNARAGQITRQVIQPARA